LKFSDDVNYESVEAAEIACSSTGVITERTSAVRLMKTTTDVCFNFQYPIASGNVNHCVFCGASGIGFPFNVRDTNRELFDVLEFTNIELPIITAGSMA